VNKLLPEPSLEERHDLHSLLIRSFSLEQNSQLSLPYYMTNMARKPPQNSIDASVHTYLAQLKLEKTSRFSNDLFQEHKNKLLKIMQQMKKIVEHYWRG
jgi:hypothetical protein